VLEARARLRFSTSDVYLNVAGGLRISEPAADLAVAAALISSLTGRPAPQDCVVFGEIGLSGEVRPVVQTDARLKEAAKLGFTAAIAPRLKRDAGAPASLRAHEVRKIADLVAMFGNSGRAARTAALGGAEA